MIRPPGRSGVAFTLGADGDMRGDPGARSAVSGLLGISDRWATVAQVHGAGVVLASAAGDQGPADAVFTQTPGLPLAVFTADCLGVVVEAERGVGVAHAGWRGLAAGVIGELVRAMHDAGIEPLRAAVGPSIGACCYEVGPEVVAAFPGHIGHTTWGSPSVDLWGVAAAQLEPIPVWMAGRCTRHEPGCFSHRADGTGHRMAAIGWLSP
ncbi:MAG: polyphenol oxidase family protein [Acidimicrobiia bacterium]|jgi:polyphenol oxidase